MEGPEGSGGPWGFLQAGMGQVEADSRQGRWGTTLPLFLKFTETRLTKIVAFFSEWETEAPRSPSLALGHMVPGEQLRSEFHRAPQIPSPEASSILPPPTPRKSALRHSFLLSLGWVGWWDGP